MTVPVYTYVVCEYIGHLPFCLFIFGAAQNHNLMFMVL